MAKPSFHEDLQREEAVRAGSDRGFGFVFAAFFAIVGGVRLWLGHEGALWWLVAAALTGAVALVAPRLLAPLNRMWMRLGLLLFYIISPLVMALLYFACVAPVGLLMQAFGQDPMRRRFDRAAKSYWIERSVQDVPAESMKNQF